MITNLIIGVLCVTCIIDYLAICGLINELEKVKGEFYILDNAVNDLYAEVFTDWDEDEDGDYY